ncbi:uncharacterized protein TNCV_3447971 [Trichonephila clavipes]|nr:uncharacterized protein TNCV_3447971 [Trichonephila clavipes]
MNKFVNQTPLAVPTRGLSPISRFRSPSPYRRSSQSPSPTLGLLASDHVILNHGQVTWTTSELAPPLLTTTPHQREDVSALDRFNVHRCKDGSKHLLFEKNIAIPSMVSTYRNGKSDAWVANLQSRNQIIPSGMCIGQA